MRALVWIVALLALGAVALYAVQTFPARIEADLKQRSTEALSAASLNFAKVSVTGRVVTLSGEAPGPTAKEDAVKVAGDVWGVARVSDALVVNTSAQPVAPQTVITASAQISERTPPTSASRAPVTEAPAAPASPPEEAPSSGILPSVGSLIDPALAPPIDSEPSETPPAPEEHATTEQPAAAPIPSPPEPTPATAPAPSTTVATLTPPGPATAPPVVPIPAAPAPSSPEPTPTPVPAPSTTAATLTPPASTPAQPVVLKPAPPAAPIAPLPKEAVAQGVTAGLTAAIQSIPSAAAAAPPAYRLEAHVEGRRVELQGLVSTPSAQRALVAHVRRQIRHAQIVDTLKVAHAKPDKDWLGVARTGLAQLGHLDTGSLKLDGHSVAVSGKPKSEKDRTRVLAALNELPHGYTSTVLLERTQEVAPPPAPAIAAAPLRALAPAPVKPSLPMHEPVKPVHTVTKPRVAVHEQEPESRSLSTRCRRRFSDVLPRVAVAFESGSWRVESAVGLDDFARIARQCPQARIRLTGHSDTEEVPAAAIGLSRQRASAVRAELEERGVSGANISVAGSGGLRPAFSNATADGRENNRRVEFAVR